MELMLVNWVEGKHLEALGFEKTSLDNGMFTKQSEEKKGVTMTVFADTQSRLVWLCVDNNAMEMPRNEVYRNENIIYGAMEEDDVYDNLLFDLWFEMPTVIFQMLDLKLIERKE